MNSRSSGFSEGGKERLHAAIEEQVRREFEQELSEATEYWANVAVEKEIEKEVEKRMKQVASPQSLWVRRDHAA